MKFKKTSIIFLSAVCAALMALGLAACGGNNNAPTLASPVISHDGRLIEWEAVEGATGYEVLENGTSVGTVEELSYTIAQSAGGEYSYTVKATGEGGAISEESNALSLTVLSAPVISISGDTISWAKVEGASYYQVYIGETKYKRYGATTVSSKIDSTKLAPGSYTCTVVAEGKDDVLDSVHSNGVEYKTPLPVTVNAPADYTGSVTVKIYSGSTEVGSQTVTLTDGTGTAEFDLGVGNYVVKTTVDDGYVAAWEYITEANPGATVTIIKKTDENTLAVGENTVTVPAATGEDGEAVMYLVYIAQKTGIHSIVGSEGDSYTIALKGRTVVAPASGIEIGNFEAEDGEPLVFTITGAGEHTFELADEDIPHPIKLSPYYVVDDQQDHPEVQANIFTTSCTGVISITEADTYTFFFTTATLGGRTVTITVNGHDYVFNGDASQQKIALAAGETTITIKVEGTNADGLNVAMYVFNGEIYQTYPPEDNG